MFKLGDRVKVVSGNLYKGRAGTFIIDDGDPPLNYIVCFEEGTGNGEYTLPSYLSDACLRHVPDLHRYNYCSWEYFSMDELQSMVKYYPNTSLFRKLYPQGIVEGKFLKVVDNN